MPPPLLLASKLLALMLALRGAWPGTSIPFLPYWDALDFAGRELPWLGLGLRGVFGAATVLLLVNVAVRAAAFAAGASLLASMILSLPAFSNHAAFTACLLILAGCQAPDGEPHLIRWQYAVLYAGAFLNKFLDAAWQDGRFMDAFMTAGAPNPFYLWMTDWLPGRTAAVALSWATIVVEGALAVAFSFRRTVAIGAWGVVALHGGLFAMTLGSRFGHFLDTLFIGLIAFLDWPRDGLCISVAGRCPWLARFISAWRFADPGTCRTFPGGNSGPWLEVRAGERVWRDESALRAVARYSAATYLALFAVDRLAGLLLSQWPKLGWDLGVLILVAGLSLPWVLRREGIGRRCGASSVVGNSGQRGV